MPDDSSLTRRDSLIRELAGLTTEAVNGSRPDLDTMRTFELVREMNGEDARVPEAVAQQAEQIALAIDGIVERFRAGGRLIYLGAGTAGRIGILDASECPPTFGTPPDMVVGLIAGGTRAIQTAVENSEDDTEAAAEELRELGLSERDTVVGISASGRTPYVVAGLTFARAVGALTVGLACNSGSTIGEVADIPIEVVVGPEFVSGSTRLKSGTAQKLAVNMLTTISMIKLGKTYNGVMVDLQATNEKLQARSERTVMDATGADVEAARAALLAAGGSVKVAILMLVAGLDSEESVRALEAADGVLRVAIGAAAASGHVR